MWSPEARVLAGPAAIYRELVRADQPSVFASRVFLLACALGVFVSAMTGPRITPRLVLDGAVSFALIPAVELAALALVLSSGVRRRLPFRQAAGWFLIGNAPWLAWIVAVVLISNLIPMSLLGIWLSIRDVSMLVPIAISFYIDLQFFREVSGRSRAGAWRDAIVFRAIGWTIVVAYFFGTSIYGQAAPILLGMVS